MLYKEEQYSNIIIRKPPRDPSLRYRSVRETMQKKTPVILSVKPWWKRGVDVQ